MKWLENKRYRTFADAQKMLKIMRKKFDCKSNFRNFPANSNEQDDIELKKRRGNIHF